MNPEDVGTMARQIAGIPEPGPREFLPTLATWERMLRDDAGFEGVARGRGIYDRFSKAAEVVPRDMLTQKTRRDIFVQDLTGATPEDIATGIPQMKVAKGLFGIDDPSDEAFDAAMNQWVGEKVATRDLVAQMARRVTDAAIQNKPLEVLLKEAKAETGEKFPLVESVMREAHARVLGEFSPEQIRVADGLFGQVAAMEGADVETQEMFAPFGDYLRMDQAGREKVLSAIAMRAESEGQDVEGFFAQKAAALRSGAAFTSLGLFTRAKRSEAAALRQVAERGTVPATWGENWMDTAELSVWVRQTEEATFGGAAGVIRDAAAAINPEAFEKQVKLTDEQKNVLLDRADEIEGQAVFAADLVSSGVKIKRYISEEKGKLFILSSMNRYLTMAAESAPMMATMAAPYGGGLVVYGTSAREVNMAELRRETGQAELNEGQKMVATVAGVLEAGVERLQFLTLGARVPRLKAATLRIPIVGKPANWMGKAAAVTGLESGQEVVQDLTMSVVQSLASALSEDIPGVAWGEVLEREMQALPDIIGVSMVFGVIGATGSSVVDYFNRDAVKAHLTNQDWIESRGIPAEVAQQISELAQTNVGAAAETLKAEMMERPLDERKKNAEAWVDRKAQSIEQALKGRRRAELPEIVRNDDGTPGVRYPDGTVVPTETLDGAVELMREWQLNDDAIMERTARELAQMLTQSHQGNPLLNVEASFTGEQMTMTTREWAGDAKISIEKARERVRTALRDEGMNPDEVAAIGDEQIDQMRITVRGSSTNRILGDTTTIAMKIHKSGRVDTVLEEHAEGVAKWILQSKKMSEAEMIRNLRETERMLGIDRLGNVEEMTPELRGQAIAESFSYLAVANFFGKVPEARNLSDRFKMFLRALRDAFAAILETAAGIRQLSEQGKLDADFERYLDIAGGLDTGYVKDGLDRQAEQEIRDEIPGGETASISMVSPVHDASRVGTARLGTKAKPRETTQDSNISGEIVPEAVLAKQMAQFVYPEIPADINGEQDPQKKREMLIDWIADNLLALHDAFPEEYRERATHWYDGARAIADFFVEKYELTSEQAAGILAVLSPQKDWFMNVAQAEQVIDIWMNHRDLEITEELVREQIERISAAAQLLDKEKKKPKSNTPRAKAIARNYNRRKREEKVVERRVMLEEMIGKTVATIDDPVLQGWTIRTLSQAIHGTEYSIILPEGEPGAVATKKDGNPGTNTWGATAEIIKVVRIVADGSLENISEQLGNEHKVRNFYNNIVAPNSPYGDATIDTHAVAAGHLMPYGASANAVKRNLGTGPGAGAKGVSGTYHIYLDAYRKAAAARGIQPRQMQSITWEAIRLLFQPEARRSNAVLAKVLEQWQIDGRGKSRKAIVGGRLADPAWARSFPRFQSGGNASDLRKAMGAPGESRGGLLFRGGRSATSGVTFSIERFRPSTGGTFSIAGVPGPVIMFSDRVIETADGGRIETFTVENENRNRTKQWKTHKTLRDVIAGTSGSRRIGDIPLWRGQLDIQHPRVAIVIGYTLDPSDLEMYYEDDAIGGVVSVESTDALPGWEYREEFGVVVKEGFDGTLEEAETEYLAMTIEDWLKIIDFSHSSVKVAKFLRPDDTTNSIGIEQDRAYMAAVEAGDMQTAQAMVDEAAEKAFPNSHVREQGPDDKTWEEGYRAAGPLQKRFHGGRKGITSFRETRRGERSAYNPDSLHAEGIWTASYSSPIGEGFSDYDAATYAQNYNPGQVYRLFVNITNPAKVPDSQAHLAEYRMDALKAKGFDGAMMMESGVWVAFDPEQVKSADPVTRDAQGNVIPLSQRFNPQDDRITHSIGLDDSPLSREIRARVRAPEQKAEVFSGMSERVAKVRQRFEQRRLAGDLDVDQSAEEALANLELEREQLQARHQQQIAEVRERVDRQARNEGQARRRNVEGARRASEVRDRGRTEIARLQTRQAKELAELDQQIARAEDDLKRARSTDARFDQLRDIATLEAIARSLPPAIRGKLSGSFRTLAQMDTSAKREDYLLDLLPKIESSLERYLQDLYRKGIRNVLKRGAVAVSDARTRGGKIGPAGHAIFDQAKAAMLIVGDDPDGMTAIEKVEQQTEEITRQIEASGEIDMEMLDELDGRRAALELFYDFQNADSARLAEGLDFLRSVYSDGRKAWLETLAARKAQRTERIETLLRGMNHDRSRAGRAAAKRQDEKGSLGEWIMEFGISGSQTLRRLGERTDDPGVQQMVQDLEDAFGAAEALESDLNIADQQSLANALRRILGVKTEWGVASKLRELSTNDGKDVPVTSLEGRKTVEISVPINEAQALVNGETSKIASGKDKGTELSLAQRQQLEAMLEEHEATPEGDRRKIRVFKVSTVEAAGERVTLGKITQLEGLQLYLTMRQPDQAEKLEGMGYDEQTRKELEAWLQPRTLKLGEWMTSQLENDQSVLDELHRKEKGVALALVENYFPVRNDVARADHSGLSLDGQGQQQSGRATGFVKQRVTNSAEPAIVDALSVFLAHRAQVNFWKSHVTPIREWGGVLRDQKLADGVRQSMGQQYYNALRQRLDRIESGGRLKGGRVMGFDRFVKSLMRRMALSVLGMRLSTLMVNISAGMNVGLHMPVKDFVKGLVKVMKRPEAFREAWKSPAIRRRIQEGSTFEARIAKTSGPSKRPTIQTLESAAEKGVSPINYIDTGANTLGAAVIWEHTRQEALAAGMTEEQAAKQAEIAVERFFRHAAQPTSRLSRSEMELTLLESPIGALFAMFVSEPRKNGAIAYMALRELATGLGTAGKGLAVQQAAVSLVAMIAVENVLRSLYDALVRADPEDEDTIFGRFWEKMFDAKAWSHRIATSHLTGIPLIGAGWEFFTANLINATDIPGNDVMAWNTSQNPLIRMIGKSKRAVRKIATGDSEDLVDDSVDAIQGAGLLPGVPLFSQLANVVEAGKGTYDSTWSEEGRVERFAYRAKKAYDEFPIRDEDGEIDRDLQEKRWIWYADYLESALLPHSKSFREKAIEKIKPAKAVRERMGLQ